MIKGAKMEKEEKERKIKGPILSLTSSADLRGRQSVRATFKLTEKAVNMVSSIAALLGIKQKSLFDHLLEDMELLHVIAREIRPEDFNPPNRIQKTYVLSKRTLSCLQSTSESYDTPRDALVEYSIKRLLPLIQKEQKRHEGRKELLEEFGELLNQGNKILEKSRMSLGDDDPVSQRINSAMTSLANAYAHMESFVQKGALIEKF
jgi:hypothetical protein